MYPKEWFENTECGIIRIYILKKRGVIVTENERIVENVNASMRMEGMPLTEEEKKIGLQCLNGEMDFHEVIDGLIKHYKQKQVV